MLDVFFTVDVEIWCDGWHNIDEKFPKAFHQYVYGKTPKGNYGLPYKLDVLNEYGLEGVFFVEPLFSTRFGKEPLAEIIELINEKKQEVQLHLHPEWVDESSRHILDNVKSKRQFLRDFSIEEQVSLIALGKKLIEDAGGRDITAFRAGSFGFNRDTLRALAVNNIYFDSSYNASKCGLNSGVAPGITLTDPFECDGVYEYPMTVFADGSGSLRHTQLTACSHMEMEGLLWQALAAGRKSFVILSHNFEFLNQARNRADTVVINRFRKLCSFLDRNRDCFRVCGFNDLLPHKADSQALPLTSPTWKTGMRFLEQAYRVKYR
jgi:hypothetical protein